MKVLNFDDFGKEFIKSQRMSPDSFVQMAIQLAFYKMHKVPAATYERYVKWSDDIKSFKL